MQKTGQLLKTYKEGCFYVAAMFPYASGIMHFGHVKNYEYCNFQARYKLIKGYDVFCPMGWDALGWPAEQAAIKYGVNPVEWTNNNVNAMEQSQPLYQYKYYIISI